MSPEHRAPMPGSSVAAARPKETGSRSIRTAPVVPAARSAAAAPALGLAFRLNPSTRESTPTVAASRATRLHFTVWSHIPPGLIDHKSVPPVHQLHDANNCPEVGAEPPVDRYDQAAAEQCGQRPDHQLHDSRRREPP